MVVFVCVVYLNVSSFISGGLYAALQYVSTTATVNILVILGRSTLPEITTKAYKVHLPYKDVAGLFAATVDLTFTACYIAYKYHKKSQ